LKARPWPDGTLVGHGVTEAGPVSVHPSADSPLPLTQGPLPEAVVEEAPAYSPKGVTYLEAVARGVDDALRAFPESFVMGEDVGFPYGNAFLLLKPLVEQHRERIFNSTLAEAGIIGACVGAALEGMRPIGEMQFNDFVATGFNELVNNAAKTRYRTGQAVPMVLRMPWGGLRRAGPYHSQDTSPWFYRTPGLHIVAPSTPHDARALMMSAVASNDPVLYYEHIGLYRDPKIKQLLPDEPPVPIPLGKAAFRRLGDDLSLVSYGAYVHRAMRAAERLEREHGISCDVVDLRSLSPIDYGTLCRTVERTGKVLLVGEDSRTGSLLESIACRLGESLFDRLDAPIRVLGALDAPVPYAPSLEDAYLLSEELLFDSALALARF
ncbi:MAG: alpha-ketoacid dehydrogenase subunit beta, partial [Myxococcota bacterium]